MATIHWRIGINGQFNDALDWSSHTVPTTNDDVDIDARGTYTVTVSTSHTIRSLKTIQTATLAVTGGTFTITNAAGTSINAGTISVSAGAALAIGGAFANSGRITLNVGGLFLPKSSDLVIASNVALSGGGTVVMNASGNGAIVAARPRFPFQFPFLSRLAPTITLTNVNNTIVGAGTIGSSNLVLVNEGTIDGNSRAAALKLNTGTHQIRNTGLVEGTTAQGVVIVSNVSNSGTLEALGTDANLTLDGTVTQTANGVIKTSGSGAHVGLSSATISGGHLQIGSGGAVESIAGTGLSTIANVAVTGPGTLEANDHSELSVTNSTLATNVVLMSNGNGSVLSVGGTVGALAGTISGGEIEFKGASASNITFTQGQVGTLKLDSSFTGTVSGLVGAVPQSFTNFFAFGDSTIDSGALRYLSPDLPSPPNPGLTNRLQNALANGGTDSPVGVGSMNSQLLAADFGLSANTAYTTGGGIGGGGTNYAIAGAMDAADNGSGTDPGNGGISNINQVGTTPNPALLSTVSQIESYLNSVGGTADPSGLYLISSGGNDYSYATNNINVSQQHAYMYAQADTLAAEIEKLSAAGAEHIIVNGSMNANQLAIDYSQHLFADLDASGIPYVKSDVYAMTQDVIANPTAYGFTSTTVHHGVEGPDTESALIQTIVPGKTFNGWGLWGANTTAQETGVLQENFRYSYLSSSDAEQTHFYSDDQHLSAAGQQIQANFDYNLVAADKIDLTNLAYAFGNTVASFSGTSAGGTLSVTNGTDSANIALLGNYLASTFVTASDGAGGTLVMDQSSNTPPQLLAVPHTA